MKRLEEVISAYWFVGVALRHPDSAGCSCADALDALAQSDRLIANSEEYWLSEEMHILRYDIIEGNDEWREKRKVQDSQLIQFTKS